MSLHVYATGDKRDPAIVFLHGLGVSSWMWTQQVEQLSGRFFCVTVDLPGNGASHGVPWRSFGDTAAAVADVVAGTPSGRAHVVGLSLGGYVALTLTARHPELVGNVVVSGVTATPMTPAWSYRLATRAGAVIMRRPTLCRAYGVALRMPSDARAAMAADARVLSAATTRRIYDEIVPFRAPSRLERVLAVAASHDAALIRRGLNAFAAAGATVAVAPNAHHAWNAEHPDLFSDMVAAWVTDRTVAPGLADGSA
ncbi:alpha/beta hydrolase [Asanoa sp. WMMD1127]|uniref:alpha/beta fold hydrolase n=1 Tax=Asanoa sp. WMMD1127 TaxID=3016107 RepID=UPI002417EFAF|nr:alpha/beta hydrolase family protein [Asanoa sp. WMMD1127]MDG4823269.1 alpha/beta hydrolase [Asanoa sp. WMMD1127]